MRMKGGRKGSSFDRHRMKRMASEANARAHTVIVISNPNQKSCAISIYEVKRDLTYHHVEVVLKCFKMFQGYVCNVTPHLLIV